MNKKEFIRISLPKETYNLLTNKIQQMNYINLKEYILKKLLIDLLNENLSNININNDNITSNYDIQKVNKDKIVYVRFDNETFRLLKMLASKNNLTVSGFIRNIIKDYLEKNLKS